MEDKNQINDSSIPSDPNNPSNILKKSYHISNLQISLLIFVPILIVSIILAFTLGTNLRTTPVTTNTTDSLSETSPTPTQSLETTTPTNTIEGLVLDTNKNYGNKYANGILPVGDSKYTTSAKKGYIYLCNTNLNPQEGGAGTRGPWFVNNNTEWDINKKLSVSGSVSWQPSLQISLENGKRILKTNDIPNHKTGVFPIASSDPVHKYDGNPNKISTQSLTYTLEANPQYGTPNCMGGEVGIMLTGVALFDAFDAGGRDAGAWEVQDGCDGHPQVSGEYHYHTLSKCITDQSVSTVIGYALDGFPITGPKVGDNNFLTTVDLDECHGITSEITLDGKKVTMYHYVMTEDFPYSASCFRAKATQPPGQHEGTQNQQNSTIPSGSPQNGTRQLPPPQR